MGSSIFNSESGLFVKFPYIAPAIQYITIGDALYFGIAAKLELYKLVTNVTRKIKQKEEYKLSVNTTNETRSKIRAGLNDTIAQKLNNNQAFCDIPGVWKHPTIRIKN